MDAGNARCGARFSAACFYFARELQRTVDVPMGLIQAAWGGSRIEAWTSADALRGQGGMDEALDILARSARDPLEARAAWGRYWQHWWATREGAAGDAPWRADTDDRGWSRTGHTGRMGAVERARACRLQRHGLVSHAGGAER
jgi:sialate O-acetylesterase